MASNGGGDNGDYLDAALARASQRITANDPVLNDFQQTWSNNLDSTQASIDALLTPTVGNGAGGQLPALAVPDGGLHAVATGQLTYNASGSNVLANASPALVQQAQIYSLAHIHSNLDLSNPNDRYWYDHVRQDLESLYVSARSQPTAQIIGPMGEVVSGSHIVSDLSRIKVTLTDAPVDNNAVTIPSSWNPSSARFNIYMSVPSLTQYQAAFGSPGVGVNYVLFHELGHASGTSLSYGATQGYRAGSTPTAAGRVNIEAYANTMGGALAAFAGVSYPTDAQLTNFNGTLPRR